ncbi:MAG TPA: YbhB/YbcL family Raf kinase inhibitor-like protein [bacterium]|nr:YbhB/YbcL family Raf kinase inhibitor-like protein [bacterium]
MVKRIFVILCVLAVSTAAWAAPKKRTGIFLHSNSFQDGGMIPDKYTCGKGNLSPELNWKNPPAKTKCFALVVDDPDAPTQTWVHWVVFNIPLKRTGINGDTFELLENFPRVEKSQDGILQGSNDFKNIGYDGPCPPSGLHRYFFKLYALDALVNLPAGASKGELEHAMAKHILAWTQIMGLYGK